MQTNISLSLCYSVFLRIHSECGKIRTRKTPITNNFHALLCHKKYNVENPNRLTNGVFDEPMRCRFLFKTEDHPFFLWSHSNNYQRRQWGAIGKATWLISLKLRLNQKWISSCKKVYLPKYIMSKLSKSLKLFEKRRNVILIWMFFAMFMIFHNFEVISDNNCGGPDNEIRKSIKLSGVWIKKYANILGPWH